MSKDDDEFLVHEQIERDRRLKAQIVQAARNKDRVNIKRIITYILHELNRPLNNLAHLVNKAIEWYKDTWWI